MPLHARAKPLIKREALAWFPEEGCAFKIEDFNNNFVLRSKT